MPLTEEMRRLFIVFLGGLGAQQSFGEPVTPWQIVWDYHLALESSEVRNPIGSHEGGSLCQPGAVLIRREVWGDLIYQKRGHERADLGKKSRWGFSYTDHGRVL